MIRITHDVFDIASRIKEIDSRYELYYNRDGGRYEVYVGEELSAVIPYDTLDVRTVDYLRRTRRENIDRLLAYIDSENERLEKETECEMRRRAEERVEEVMHDIKGSA